MELVQLEEVNTRHKNIFNLFNLLNKKRKEKKRNENKRKERGFLPHHYTFLNVETHFEKDSFCPQMHASECKK